MNSSLATKIVSLVFILLGALNFSQAANLKGSLDVQRSLDVPNSMSYSLSYDYGKTSKGKKSKSGIKAGKSLKKTGSSKNTKMPKSPKIPKSPKSPKSKGKNKGKGKVTGPTKFPTPTKSPTSVAPVTSTPTIATTEAPTMAPPAPLDYKLFYTIVQTRLPLASEYNSVAGLTGTYLNEYFRSVFDSTSLTNFKGSNTVLVSNRFNFNQPIEIAYETTVTFYPSANIPTHSELNTLLAAAFTGDKLNTYLGLIQALPSSNIFSTTSVISFQSVSSASASSSSTARNAGLAAAAGTGAIIFIIAGISLLRNRRSDSEEITKYIEGDGHMTIAGDTYEGTCEASSAYDNASSDGRAARCVSPTDWGDFVSASQSSRCESPTEVIDEGNEEEGSDDGTEASLQFEEVRL